MDLSCALPMNVHFINITDTTCWLGNVTERPDSKLKPTNAEHENALVICQWKLTLTSAAAHLRASQTSGKVPMTTGP